MEAIVFIILQIFFAMRAVLKIGEYSRIFPSISWGIFAHVTRLDQSFASKNIWWIIIQDIRIVKTVSDWLYHGNLQFPKIVILILYLISIIGLWRSQVTIISFFKSIMGPVAEVKCKLFWFFFWFFRICQVCWFTFHFHNQSGISGLLPFIVRIIKETKTEMLTPLLLYNDNNLQMYKYIDML